VPAFKPARGGWSGPLGVVAAVVVAGLCASATSLHGGALFWLGLAAIPVWLLVRRR